MLVMIMMAGTTLTTNFIADETDKKNNATDYIVVTNNENALEEANDICSVYEDNSYFYNRRFEEAYLACDQVGIEGYKTPDLYFLSLLLMKLEQVLNCGISKIML